MHTYISMLRGINVSGQKKVNIIKLKELYRSLKFKNIKAYIQSGNISFESSETNITALISLIEKKIKQFFGFDVLVFIRTKYELQNTIKNNPFKDKDTANLYVTFLYEKPLNFQIEEVNKVKDKTEEFSISSREIYIFCPNGYGKTKLSNNFFERKLKVSATTRNWQTIITTSLMAE